MLRQGGLDAAVLEEVGQWGASLVEGFLTAEGQKELLMALEKAPYQQAAERVGDVQQDFDQLVVKPGAAFPTSGLAALLTLADEYTAFIKAQAAALHQAWLADFAPTDISLQRYWPASLGITAHRDSRRYVKLISIFSLGGAAELRLCRDRQGTPLRRYRLASGDLLLLRAPGFAGAPCPRPLHSVSGPRGEVRYSIAFRIEQQIEAL